MNEVKATSVAPQVTTNASSKGTVSTQAPEAVDLSAVVKASVEQTKELSAESVKEAVADINDFVQSVQRDLQFSVDEELGSTVVKVLDRQSGDLIRQIPNDVVLDLARNLKENGDIHLLSAQG